MKLQINESTNIPAEIIGHRNYDGVHAFIVHSPVFDDYGYVNKLRKVMPEYEITTTGFSDEVAVFADESELQDIQKYIKRFNTKYISPVNESIDITGYKYITNKNGYNIYRKIENGKGIWAAKKNNEEPFEITYEQARGFEPINPEDSKLQHTVKKALKMESTSNETIYRVWYRPYLLDDEEDYVEITATSEKEARERGNSYGYVTEIEVVESLNESVDKETIENALTDFVKYNGHKDLDRIQKRIARVGEFDNGRVMHGDWKKMSMLDAEELAKQMSIKNPDKTYYVQYDDIMIGASDIKWKNGELIESYLTEDHMMVNGEEVWNIDMAVHQCIEAALLNVRQGVMDFEIEIDKNLDKPKFWSLFKSGMKDNGLSYSIEGTDKEWDEHYYYMYLKKLNNEDRYSRR